MDNTRLEYLRKVAEYGSISKAAEDLFITSSALSKYIKKIEEEYGTPLFDRVGKRFELTYAGERYLSWLGSIASLYDQMETEMRDIARSFAGRLRVGVQLAVSDDILDRVLPEFCGQYPDILIELHEDTSSGLRKRLEDNELDLVIVPDGEFSSALEKVELREEHLVLVTPAGHPVGRTAVRREGFRYPWVNLGSLSEEEPFVAPFDDQGQYRVFRRMAEVYDRRFRIILQTRTISRMIRFVGNGMACTLSLDSPVRGAADLGRIELYSVGKRPEVTEMVIAYNRSHYLNRAADRFIELCKRSML